MAAHELPTCVVVDDHAVIREALVMRLEDWGGLRVVGEASNWHAAVEAVGRLAPDVALVDLRMPGGSGLDVAAAVGACRTRFVIVSACVDRAMVDEARRAGASGYITKEAGGDVFAAALSAVLAGAPFVDAVTPGGLEELEQAAASTRGVA